MNERYYDGLLKKRYYASDVSTMDDLVQCVTQSTTANKAIIMEEGVWTDWRLFVNDNKLEGFSGISNFNNISITKCNGVIQVTGTLQNGNKQCFLPKLPINLKSKTEIKAPGLSVNRYNYLASKVLHYVKDLDKENYRSIIKNRLHNYQCC